MSFRSGRRAAALLAIISLFLYGLHATVADAPVMAALDSVICTADGPQAVPGGHRAPAEHHSDCPICQIHPSGAGCLPSTQALPASPGFVRLPARPAFAPLPAASAMHAGHPRAPPSRSIA